MGCQPIEIRGSLMKVRSLTLLNSLSFFCFMSRLFVTSLLFFLWVRAVTWIWWLAAETKMKQNLLRRIKIGFDQMICI